MTIDDGAPSIPADKNRLEQVIFNRVTNGRDVIENRVVFQENAEAGLEIIEKGSPRRFGGHQDRKEDRHMIGH